MLDDLPDGGPVRHVYRVCMGVVDEIAMSNKDVVHGRKRSGYNSVEVKKPKQAANVMIAMAETAETKVTAAMKRDNLPPQTQKVLKARVRELYPNTLSVLKDLSKDSFINTIQELRRAALWRVHGLFWGGKGLGGSFARLPPPYHPLLN